MAVSADISSSVPHGTLHKQHNQGRPQIDLHQRAANRARSTNDMLQLLRAEAPAFYDRTEIVGAWLWIQFPDRQPVEITSQLAQLGFHWNNARQAWQHPCGKLTAGSPGDPREKYGTRCPADYQPA